MTVFSADHLRALDRAHYIHPYTDHEHLHAAGTHLIQRGEGCWVWDMEGRRLMDGLAGLWCVNVGYGRREIIEAVERQMREVAFYPSFFNTATEAPIRLAAKIAELAPEHLTHTTFSNSGSEANETAIKAVLWYHRLRGEPARRKIVTRTWAYHGVTLATTSMTGLTSCTEPFGLPLPGFVQVPGPYHYGANTEMSPVEYGRWCLQETERMIVAEDPATIAAMFVEPVQGAGGVIVPPEGYLPGLREICRRHGILFVADEVISGFGRLGAWFGNTLWDLQPDIMTTAKGLSSGYLPIGATVFSRDIAAALLGGGYFAHGFTYSGHPTAAAAALANIGILEHDQLIPAVRDQMGPYFQSKLHELSGHPAVGEIRGMQLVGAIELVPKGGKSALDPKIFLGGKVMGLIRQEGAIVRGIRNLIAVSPALVVTHEEVDYLFDAVRRGLNRFLHESGA